MNNNATVYKNNTNGALNSVSAHRHQYFTRAIVFFFNVDFNVVLNMGKIYFGKKLSVYEVSLLKQNIE